MINSQVTFNGDDIIINGFCVFSRNDIWVVVGEKNEKLEDYFDNLEQAIKHCLEN